MRRKIFIQSTFQYLVSNSPFRFLRHFGFVKYFQHCHSFQIHSICQDGFGRFTLQRGDDQREMVRK